MVVKGWIRMNTVISILLFLISLFLILLVLIQRGKGGGLAGAFGGMGGSSAFGARAGDAFTRITLYTAGIWVFLIIILVRMNQPARVTADTRPVIQQQQPSAPEGEGSTPAGEGEQ
jgi:preprotein translocase subunit SecG